jgi:Immunity protein 35
MTMINIEKSEALKIVQEHISKLQEGRSYQLAVMHDRTREEDFGWVFFYNTRQFIETGDWQWSLGGNAPLIVDRRTGELHVTGTAYPIEHYIAEYRKARMEMGL